MNKSSLSLIFTIAFCFLASSVHAQADIPELILEETEGGYIIVNWEDTRVEDEFPQQGDNNDIPELILEETEGGYIIVNWEDTRTEDEEATPSDSEPSTGNSGSGSSGTKKTVTKKGKSVKKSVKYSSKKRNLRSAAENNN